MQADVMVLTFAGPAVFYHVISSNLPLMEYKRFHIKRCSMVCSHSFDSNEQYTRTHTHTVLFINCTGIKTAAILSVTNTLMPNVDKKSVFRGPEVPSKARY